MQLRSGTVVSVLVGLIWATSIGLGTRAVATFENTPGRSADAPREWPGNGTIVRSPNRFTLVLFAHPDCPCTRASLTELEKLMTHLHGRLEAFVWFRKPDASLQDTQRSSIWKRASSIPGVTAGFDADGSIVRRFGAEVSGQTMLYDPDGRLVFSGGITDARGHEGDNDGEDAILLRVNGQEARLHTSVLHTRVFGCSLVDPDAGQLAREYSWTKN
jgi:hypothetical protein